MRMPVIGLLLLASLSLCAAAPYNSIIFNEDTEKNIVAKEIEVHFHETNASDQNRKGRLQLSFGDVNGAISVESNVVTNNNQGTGGVWSSWSEFGSCSATCGAATKKRERTCSGGAECTGANEEVVDCTLSECVIDGSWTKFSDWSVCSKTCGEGNKVRSRTCTNPPPSNGGGDCVGQNFEVQSCMEVKNCPIDGGWTVFSDWSVCSKTCGEGEKKRTRTCTNPPPSDGGQDCLGQSEEVQSCVEVQNCAIDGGWTKFSDWSPCSKTCGEGNQLRTRTCSNPPPSNGGQDCVGQNWEVQSCVEVQNCPIDGATDGGWSVWGDYSSCSATCGSATKKRERTCTNPAPANGGAQCSGSDEDIVDCELPDCEVSRSHRMQKGQKLFGDKEDSLRSQNGEYDLVMQSDGNLVIYRNNNGGRTVKYETGTSSGAGCYLEFQDDGNLVIYNAGAIVWATNTQSADSLVMQDDGNLVLYDGHVVRWVANSATDGGWSVWGDYSSCSATCGSATKKRERTCTNPAPANGGAQCPGSDEDIVACDLEECAIDGGWTIFGECTKTCEGGLQTRTCTNPSPQHGGEDCIGEASQSCNDGIVCITDPVLLHADETYEYYKIAVAPSRKMMNDVILSTCSEQNMKPQCQSPYYSDTICVQGPTGHGEVEHPKVMWKILCPSETFAECSFLENMFWYMKANSGWNEGSGWGYPNQLAGKDYTSTSDHPYFAACVKIL